MRQNLAGLFAVLILAACAIPQSVPEIPTVPANSQPCMYVWGNQALPDLSAKVQSAFNTAGLKDIQASAEAYGENCVNPQSNKVRGFATIETDFHITVKVAEFTNTDDLGELLEKILVILDAFPVGKIPGPQPGYISITFQSGKAEWTLSFTASAWKAARLLGLHGAALFEKLQKK
jgi:hypothetical protein